MNADIERLRAACERDLGDPAGWPTPRSRDGRSSSASTPGARRAAQTESAGRIAAATTAVPATTAGRTTATTGRLASPGTRAATTDPQYALSEH